MGESSLPTAGDYAQATADKALKLAQQLSGPRPAKKVRKRSTAASRAVEMDLSEGDTLDYSISASIRTKRGGEMWIKAGATTTIRATETTIAAKDRLRRSVEFMIDEAAGELR